MSMLPQWFLRSPLLRGLAILLIGFLGFMIFRHTLWQEIREWRARQLTEEARTFATDGDWDDAERKATAALELDRTIDSLRLLVDAWVENRRPEAVQGALALFREPEATIADRARALEVLLDRRDFLAAAACVSTLSAAERQDPALRYQFVRFLLRSARLEEAMVIADEQPEDQRDLRLDLLLARALAWRDGPEAGREVDERLGRVLSGPDRDLAVTALRDLTAVPDPWANRKALRAAIERFQDDPDLEVADALRVDLIRIGLREGDRAAIIDEAVARCQEHHLEILVAWLARLLESERIAELTAPGEEPRGLSAELHEHRWRALVDLGRFEELAAELDAPPTSVPEPLVLAAKAVAARGLGDDTEATVFWQRAFDAAEAKTSRNHFLQLSNRAREAGDYERCMEAVARAVEHPRGPIPTAKQREELFAWLDLAGDTERLEQMYFRIHQKEPGNPIHLNNFRHANALFNEPQAQSLAAMQDLVQRFPESMDFRTTLALVLVKTGDPAAGVTVLEASGTAPTALPPEPRILYAIGLRALGRPVEAGALLETIDWSRLLPSRRSALQNLLRDTAG